MCRERKRSGRRRNQRFRRDRVRATRAVRTQRWFWAQLSAFRVVVFGARKCRGEFYQGVECTRNGDDDTLTFVCATICGLDCAAIAASSHVGRQLWSAIFTSHCRCVYKSSFCIRQPHLTHRLTPYVLVYIQAECKCSLLEDPRYLPIQTSTPVEIIITPSMQVSPPSQSSHPLHHRLRRLGPPYPHRPLEHSRQSSV